MASTDQFGDAFVECACGKLVRLPSPTDIESPMGAETAECECGAVYSMTAAQLDTRDDK